MGGRRGIKAPFNLERREGESSLTRAGYLIVVASGRTLSAELLYLTSHLAPVAFPTHLHFRSASTTPRIKASTSPSTQTLRRPRCTGDGKGRTGSLINS